MEFDSTLLYGRGEREKRPLRSTGYYRKSLWPGGIVNPGGYTRPGDAAAELEKRRGYKYLHQLPGGGGLRRRRIRVQCLPLYSLLAALGQTTVHYLVLDVEGVEMQILQVRERDRVFPCLTTVLKDVLSTTYRTFHGTS